MASMIFEILKELIVAWRDGTRKIRLAICVAAALIVIGGLIAFLSHIVL